MICPHGFFEGNCPVCLATMQVRPPVNVQEEIPKKTFLPPPPLADHLTSINLGDNLRTSGIPAFKFAPRPITRDIGTIGLLGGSTDLFSERLAKHSRDLPQLNDVRELTRLKIPHKEIRKNL